ncbi:MAG: GAF domain-containing sensor histidine kinase [Thermoleophilia bacterium]
MMTTRQVHARDEDVPEVVGSARPYALVAAGLSLAEALSPDDALERALRAGTELTGATYALGCVVGRNGHVELRHERGERPAGARWARLVAPTELAALATDPQPTRLPPDGDDGPALIVPVHLRGDGDAVLLLGDEADRPAFEQTDEDAAALLAAHVGIAIENGRRYVAAQRWVRRIESVDEIVSALLQTFDLDEVLQLVCDRLRELVKARLVFVALPGPDGHVVLRAISGGPASFVGLRVDRHGSKLGAAMRRRTPERIDSVIDDAEIDQVAARRLGVRAAIVAPLLVRDEAIGALVVADRLAPDARFSDEDVRVAVAFAERAAVAIDLGERVTRDTVQRIVEAEETERRRLARELHDETGQALTTILLGLRSLEEVAGPEALEPVREHVRRALRDVRRLAVELRPAALDDFGLVAAVERLARQHRDGGLEVEVSASGLAERLPPSIETTAYRLVQEALTNVARHAQARAARVRLAVGGDVLALQVEDDGRGLPDEVREGAMGLASMRERVALLGGRLAIDRSPLGGVRVTAELKLPPR